MVQGKERVYYEIEAGKPTVGQSWDEFFAENMITDAELQRLDNQPSLKELYVNSYTTRDLNLAIEGLKNLEAAHPEFDVLSDPEFEELVNKLFEIVPEPKEVVEDPVEQAFKREESGEITPLKMKKFLREYIAENYAEEGYALPTLSKDELVAWYKLAMEGEELPFDEFDGETSSEEAPAPTEEKEDPKPANDGVQEHDPKALRNSLKNILGRK